MVPYARSPSPRGTQKERTARTRRVTTDDMNDFQKGVTTLIRYALSEETSCPSLPSTFDYSWNFRFAEAQQILPLLYYGASKTETFQKSPLAFRYLSRVCVYISHNAKQMSGYQALADRFEADGIDFMPMKGTLLKQLYPHPEMRIMSDSDILIRPAQKKKIEQTMTAMGFETETTCDHVHEYQSPDGLHFELHRRPVPSDEVDLYRYYKDGWWTARPVEGKAHAHEMRPEDHLVFLFAHFVKHYRGYGAGIKYVVDFEVFHRSFPDLDMEYVRGELDKLGLLEFYDNVCRTLDVWFRDAEPDNVTDFLTAQLFCDTAYGSESKGSVSDAYRVAKNAGDGQKTDVKTAKRTRALQLFFLPYRDMCKKYPVLINWAILLPLFWIIRGFDILFHHRDKIDKTRESLDDINEKSISRFRDELNYVGLDKPKEKRKRKDKSKSKKKKKGEENPDAD